MIDSGYRANSAAIGKLKGLLSETANTLDEISPEIMQSIMDRNNGITALNHCLLCGNKIRPPFNSMPTRKMSNIVDKFFRFLGYTKS
jgi:hypothetical protein